MKTFVIELTYVENILERRQPYRAEHLARICERAAKGELVFAGSTIDPVDKAILVVRAASINEVHGWVDEDPYKRAGLVTGSSVREMAVVVSARVE